MPRILVNGLEQTPGPACQHWGDLLEHLDGVVAGGGQVLTAVRFDGVDEPTFRDPAGARRSICGLQVIEAESLRPRDLLENSLNEAIGAARTLAEGAGRVGGAFRGFDVSIANQDLVDLAQGLGTLVAIIQTLSQALGVALDSLVCEFGTANNMIEELSGHADALIEAQQAGDWITVADVIEYDVAPALQRWPSLFEGLRRSLPS
jgi:hypothetical protein